MGVLSCILVGSLILIAVLEVVMTIAGFFYNKIMDSNMPDWLKYVLLK